MRMEGAVGRWRAATLRSWLADDFIWGMQGLLMVGINVGLLYGALQFWERGLITVGDFVLIQAYLLGIFDQLISITRELRRVYDGLADAGEMVHILQKPHGVPDRAGAPELSVGGGAIAFDRVDFHFNAERPILRDFSLRVAGGEKVALVGPSGAGKSTITRLLLRFYDVIGGAIEIDGQDIAAVRQESLRDAIAFVPQEPILFHRTLMENIRYGRRDATDEEVMEAARKAHCHEFISALPERYDTYVGERGVRLSGGERQRIAIARAILRDAPILILDEATSSLDSESEALIQDALEKLMKGKTVIAIAHRLSTIMHMDRILVLERGAIVDEGTHEELLERGGLYQ
jgi:ABC-type multidrug transport system fused ATPase/permease subunit